MHRRVTAALAALVLLPCLSACTDDYGEDTIATTPPAGIQPVTGGTVIDPARGTASITFDQDFLGDLADRVEPAGGASGSGGTVRLPVVTGQLVASPTQLNGALVLNGSVLSFPDAGRDVRLSDLVVDLQAGTVAGTVSVDGRPLSAATLLLELDLGAATRPEAGADVAVRLSGVRLVVAPGLASRVDAALGRRVLVAGRTAGVLAVSIEQP